MVITGGAGFIGSNLCFALNKEGYENILLVDELANSQKWKNLVGLKFLDYLEKDDFYRDFVSGKLAKETDTVFHLGACSSTTEANASYLLKNNYEYTKEVARKCLKESIYFIYASSGATYGDGSAGFSDDEEKLETLRPLNMYGYSKHLFDLWAKRTGALKKICGLKYFNVFGPNEYHKGQMRSFVCKAIEKIRKGSQVIQLFKSENPDYPDGEQKRDFLYVRDAVAMTLFLWKRKLSGIYNIGSGVASTWNELARAIVLSLNKPIRIEYIEMPVELRDNYQYYTRADITKIRRAGYKKEITTLSDAVRDYVINYLLPGKYLAE